jgi:hypothetical protein
MTGLARAMDLGVAVQDVYSLLVQVLDGIISLGFELMLSELGWDMDCNRF